ncbi:6-hydroxymethylpterin diphosphokinase MptE-like protein [Haloplanus sp.]|uniref:6-hydroxymethylpterin diphosphokinase MptE-like protein n=1 Tax=Haloplanus sp. TaxID=1961696 RepID=UPI002618F916|nr:6-hydroxymethylpterin diphosphokinase MptE-like protein [Haloplanus sp.]
MNYAAWSPVYERILGDFGFDPKADERARDRLAANVDPFDERRLDRIDGATVAIAGAGPSLADETGVAAGADVVVAASAAAETLAQAGVGVDLMVTDLDKTPDTARGLTREGVPVAVHAHGDNRDAVEEWVPRLAGEHVLPTTQAEPRGPVVNYGGFTDGDRAAFLADAFGAASLRFPGWDFDDPSVSPAKRRKLMWAERLLCWLERRRDDRFAVLDGRRGGIDPL